MAIASLIMGLLCLFGDWIPNVQYGAFIFAILAIVFGNSAIKNGAQGADRSMANAGRIMGWIGIGLWILAVIVLGLLWSTILVLIGAGA